MYVEFTDISPKYPAFFLPAILLVDRPSYGTALLLVDTALSIGMLCLVIDVAGTLLHLMVFKQQAQHQLNQFCAANCKKRGENYRKLPQMTNYLGNSLQTVQSITLYTLSQRKSFFRDTCKCNTNCSGVNQILRGIFRVVCHFYLHFLLYLGNLDYILDSVVVIVFLDSM